MLFVLVALCVRNASGQAGTLDPSFNTIDQGFGNGDGPNSTVAALAMQPDGKILVGGDLTTYNGVYRAHIARVNADGSLDTGFDPGSGADDNVTTIALQPDGKVILGGVFSAVDGTARNRVARLNAAGSVDPTFDPGTGANATVHEAVVQPDGKIIIAGDLTSFNGTVRDRIARLNTNGSLDTGFDPGAGANGTIFTIALQSDGRIIIGGAFTTYNGTPRNRIARLNSDGSLDTAFDPGTGANNQINAAVLQADGKIMIAGVFNSYAGTARNRIARLNADGSLDNSFDPGTGPSTNVSDVGIDPDGRIVIAGLFTIYAGTSRKHIARLNASGSLDTTFDPGTSADFQTVGLCIQPDRKVIVGGLFLSFDGAARKRIARLNINGSVDQTFNPPGTGAHDLVTETVIQADGKIIIAGLFLAYNGTARSRIARLDTDGSLDASFDTGNGINGRVWSVAMQPDGKLIVVGDFTLFNGLVHNRIVRLNADGSLDPTFNTGSGAGGSVRSVALQTDGKIIIVGAFTSYNGTTRNRIARLNTDGGLDTGFLPGSGPNSLVVSSAIQPDGKILIAGWFTQYGGVGRQCVARVNADGTLDPGFATGTGPNNFLRTVHLQPDGKVLIGGAFTAYQGVARGHLARLNSDGSLDTGFATGSGADFEVWDLALQPDGKPVIVGWFNTYNGSGTKSIARLNTDGSLDAGFAAGTGANDLIATTAIQTDGRIIIAGDFTSYAGAGRNRVARVFGGTGTPPVLLQAKAHLGGAYDNGPGLMQDQLRGAALVPTSEPYTALGYMHVGSGGEQTTAPVLAVAGNNAIVDWVVVELRGASSPYAVIASRSALVQRDGDVVDVDGVSPVGVAVPAGDYRVAIRHRNHLGVMTATSSALSGTATLVDLTSPATATYGTNARNAVGGTMVLWSGDATGNGQLRYTGAGNDRDPILIAVGSTTPNNTVTNVYDRRDTNLDGVIKYAGAANDRDIILTNVGSTMPNTTRTQQLP